MHVHTYAHAYILRKRSGKDKLPTSGSLAWPGLVTNKGCQAPYPQKYLRVTTEMRRNHRLWKLGKNCGNPLGKTDSELDLLRVGRKGLHPEEEGGWRGFSEGNDWRKALASLPHQPEIATACPFHPTILATTQAETLAAQSDMRKPEGPARVQLQVHLTRNPWAFVPSPSSLPTPGLSYKTSIFLPKYLSLLTPLPKIS